MKIINHVLDKYFEFMNEIDGLSFIEDLIPQDLINNDKESKYNGIKHWKAIKSTISIEDINQLEEYYRHKLPESYKYFLKQKHFIELSLGEYRISFFKNLPYSIVDDTVEELESYLENPIESNYLPFATKGDHELLCFDANKKNENTEYRIVSVSGDDEDSTPEFYAEDFQSIWVEFQSHLDLWIKTKREMNNNAT